MPSVVQELIEKVDWSQYADGKIISLNAAVKFPIKPSPPPRPPRQPKPPATRLRMIPAEVQARAIELRNSGLTLQAIAEKMNKEGLRRASGQPWTLMSVHGALMTARRQAITGCRGPGKKRHFTEDFALKVESLRHKGMSFEKIVEKFEAQGIRPPQAPIWTAKHLQRSLAKYREVFPKEPST